MLCRNVAFSLSGYEWICLTLRLLLNTNVIGTLIRVKRKR